MKKDVTMRKNTFVKGALITTIGIVLTKILGIIYVIPFHAIIGDEGGALYGYAYTIYLFFVSFSSAGVPLAISRIVSEYQTLGYGKAKQRTFLIGKRLSILIGFVCFLIIFLFAPLLAKAILGNVVGGNSIQDVTFVIRVISFAVLIGPLLSIYRGFFEGHRIMSPPSISQVLEQLIRVLIIIFGSLLTLRVFIIGFVIALFSFILILVLSFKKKPIKLYLFITIFNIVLVIMLFIIRNYLEIMQMQVIENRTAFALRDFTLIGIIKNLNYNMMWIHKDLNEMLIKI